MNTLARPMILAPLAAPFVALHGFMLHLHESWQLTQVMMADARRKYPHLDF